VDLPLNFFTAFNTRHLDVSGDKFDSATRRVFSVPPENVEMTGSRIRLERVACGRIVVELSFRPHRLALTTNNRFRGSCSLRGDSYVGSAAK
jgi:hypothetical protein